MEIEDAVKLASDLLIQQGLRPLSDVETLVLRGAWEQNTYEVIASKAGYSDGYLRKDVGIKLWRDLSIAMGEPVSKTNFKAALERQWEQKQKLHSSLPTAQTALSNCHLPRHTDWGEAIDVSIFFGREEEQQILNHWVISDRCRLILLLGMGGIGKTALSIKVGQNVQSDFEYVIWRCLRNAPPVLELLVDLIKFLFQQQDVEVPHSLDGKIALLLQYLRQHRCLLILDNAESILQSGDHQGHYRLGYEGYGRLFQQIGEIPHLSCLLLTSRERPQDLASKFGQQLPMRCLTVSGLSYHDGQSLLSSIGEFSGTSPEWQSIINRYGGNPLALRIIASFAGEVFAGDLSQLLIFLGESSYIFDDIRELLDQQFYRLSDQEREVMMWLAIKREPVNLMELPGDLVHPILPPKLLQVLAALQSRSLIEKVETRFSLQPVVLEYVTRCLIEKISEELSNWQVGDVFPKDCLLQKFSLIQVQAKDYVRDTQIRLILQPVLDNLICIFSTILVIEQHLKQMLKALQAERLPLRGYAAGNIINMLRQLGVDLSGYNFSQLTVWQADLQGLTLYDVDFSGADLSNSRFSQTFGWITTLAFSRDGNYWAAGDSAGLIHLWFHHREQNQIMLKAHDSFIFTLAISPDNRLLVSGDTDGTVKLWEVSTGQCLYTFKVHNKIIWCVVFSRDSQWFASSCEDGTITIWDCNTGQCVQTLSGNNSSVRSIVFTSDRRYLVSGSEDYQVRLWDIQQNKCIRTFEGHSQTVWTVDISPDDQYIVSGGNDYIVKLWNLKSGACLQDFEGHTLQIWSVAFSPDGQTIASGSMDQTVRLWNINEKQCTACFRGHSSMVMCVAFSADGQTLASGGMDRLIKHWDLKTKACARTWSGYKNIIWSVSFSVGDNPTIASSSLDGIIRIWQVADGQCLQTMKHPTEVHAIAFSRDGKLLVSGNIHSSSTLKVWDVQKGVCLMTIPAHIRKINSVCFHPNGSLIASGGDDKNVQIFDLKNQHIHRILQGHTAVIWSVAFSQNGKLLASGSFDQTVRIWELDSGQCLNVLSGHTNALTTIVFHPFLPLIATASSDAMVKLWSLETGECDHTLMSHNNVVMGIAFSPDGQTFASGSFDKTIRIWDVSSCECRAIFQANSLVHSVAFSPDSKTLVSGGDNGTLQLWDLQNLQYIKTIYLPELYARMNIRGVKGLSEAQKSMLISLGAII